MNEPTVIASGPTPRIGPGTRLSEIYEIDGLIGIGGMGEVYKGHAIETGDEVAIKTIRPELAQNPSALGLFRKEASALHNLYHQAIVRYFVFTIDKALGLPYLAMEYVSGEALSDLIGRGPLAPDQLRVLRSRIAEGLQAAHDLGIVHRDVSPDNVILPGGNAARAKIIDFGIARSALGEGTIIGDGFAGKFSYVSPEQLGLYGGDVTGRSDIYSLGLVLAEASIGRRVDMGTSHADVIEKRRTVPDLAAVDASIRPLIQAMLQPNPADRPSSMAEVAAWDLPALSPAHPTRGPVRAKVLAGLALLTVLAVGGVVLAPIGSTWLSSTPEPAPLPEKPLAEPPANPTSPLPANVPTVPGSTGPTKPPPEPAAPAPAVPPPTAPPAPVPRASVTMEQVASYVRDYRGGSCFHLSPASVSAREAVVEGFGATPAPFMKFDTDFHETLGFDPTINLRQVTAPQCPVVDLMTAQAGLKSAKVPKLALRADVLRSGEDLSGTVGTWPDSMVDLILVGDDGLAYAITSFAKRTGDTLAFRLKIERGGAKGESRPQLVIAVASSKPLPSLKGVSGVPVDRLLRQLESETGRAPSETSISVKYFKLGT